MKILLITPPTFRESYGIFAEAGGKNAPLGILYLASILEKNNIPVELLDAEAENLEIPQILDKIRILNPDIIGVTSSTAAFNKVKIMVQEIKNNFRDIIIVIGGPHITALPKQTMETELFDFGIMGEGEYAFLELINTLMQKKDYKKIKSLVYLDKEKVIINPRRDLITDINDLPMPAFHLLKNYTTRYTPQLTAYRKKPVGTILTSRGCPFQCIFCDRNIFGNKFRARNPQNVIEEIEYLVNNYKIKELKFLDDTFTMDKERVMKICDLLIQKKFNLIWSCSIRADTIDEELLRKMKQAGCWYVGLGIESGNEKVLKDIKKNLTKEKITQCCKLAKKVGIKTRGFFIIGHPTDTKETIRETINFAKSLPLYIAEFSIATPYPNTELDRIAKDYGTIDTKDLSKYSSQFPVFIPKGLTKEYLIKMHRLARKEFYLRPKKIIEIILDIKSIEDIKRYLTGFKILVRSLYSKN